MSTNSSEEEERPRHWGRTARTSLKYPVPVTPDPLLGARPKRYIVEMIAKTDTEKFYQAKMDVMCSPEDVACQLNLQVIGEPMIIYETTTNANRLV